MTYLYDGTFSGLMSVIFYIYSFKIEPEDITSQSGFESQLFAQVKVVETNDMHSERVIKGLLKKISIQGFKNLWKSYLSEERGIEMVIYQYIKYVLSSQTNIETDYRNAAVLKVKQTVKMIHREVHRMHAFVRFQQTNDNLYVATIKPDFNVMPLVWQHFEKRYADQTWLIYDVRRNYGMYYDLNSTMQVVLDDVQMQKNKKVKSGILSDTEDIYSELWQKYFSAANIKERTNLKLHLKHVPRRYWMFLPEKWKID